MRLPATGGTAPKAFFLPRPALSGRGFFIALCAALLPGAGAALTLDLPVACTLGETCYIQHYLDRDPGPGVVDYGCGSATYEGHDGTDFALPTRAAMATGVAVIAAAPGRVRAVRDGEADGALLSGESVAGKECGNGVVIDHAEGYQTQYCHLKRGSVAVKPGEQVAAGARLGLIGLSGAAEFPHLHLTVRKDGHEIDPFHPGAALTCDTPPADGLWRAPLPYVGGGLLQAGLAAAPPDFDAVKAGLAAPATLPADAPLLLWAYGYESRAGDLLTLRLTGPGGFVFDHQTRLEKPQALFYRYGGKRAPAGGLTPGPYSAEVVLTREGREIGRRQLGVEISR